MFYKIVVLWNQEFKIIYNILNIPYIYLIYHNILLGYNINFSAEVAFMQRIFFDCLIRQAKGWFQCHEMLCTKYRFTKADLSFISSTVSFPSHLHSRMDLGEGALFCKGEEAHQISVFFQHFPNKVVHLSRRLTKRWHAWALWKDSNSYYCMFIINFKAYVSYSNLEEISVWTFWFMWHFCLPCQVTSTYYGSGFLQPRYCPSSFPSQTEREVENKERRTLAISNNLAGFRGFWSCYFGTVAEAKADVEAAGEEKRKRTAW